MEDEMLIRLRLMGRNLSIRHQRGLIFDWQIDWCLTGQIQRSID
jgi:hypothetical protein